VYFRPQAGWTRAIIFSFLYWLALLLVLEPGNIYRATQAGQLPSLSHEMLRITVAALLGTTSAPIFLVLTRNFPVTSEGWSRSVWIHALSAMVVAFVLILISCFLAAWVFDGAWLPSLADIGAELVNNWLYLVYALITFTAIAHVVHLVRAKAVLKPAIEEQDFLARIHVKTRGKTTLLDVADIDWIETQGNYLALHTNSETHLIRETLAKFEPKLDPVRFVRIHRRAIIAIDRVLTFEAIENGDAILHLANNHELRVSRRYRDEVKKRWHQLA
jgi:hypothetical protein